MSELKYRVVHYPIAGIIEIPHNLDCATLKEAEYKLNVVNEFDIEMIKLGIETNINPRIEQLVDGEWCEIASCKELDIKENDSE